jgi:hypothetical protein
MCLKDPNSWKLATKKKKLHKRSLPKSVRVPGEYSGVWVTTSVSDERRKTIRLSALSSFSTEILSWRSVLKAHFLSIRNLWFREGSRWHLISPHCDTALSPHVDNSLGACFRGSCSLDGDGETHGCTEAWGWREELLEQWQGLWAQEENLRTASPRTGCLAGKPVWWCPPSLPSFYITFTLSFT